MRRLPRLPLSWSIQGFSSPLSEQCTFTPSSLNLPLSRRQWIYTAIVNSRIDLLDALEKEGERRNLIIRGCDPLHKSLLESRGWRSRQSGIEACLQLDEPVNWTPHRSLKELSRRALRKGSIEIFHNLSAGDINFINQNLVKLRKRSHYRLRPALHNLFQNSADLWEQALIYRRNDASQSIEAIIGWSRNGPASRHLEVLLRSSSAPVGTMEALILESVELSRDQGIGMLSLGEVPFLRMSGQEEDSIGTFGGDFQTMDKGVGHSLHGSSEKPKRFASYYLMRPAFSSMGLFRFKNKFRPTWTPLYLMSNRRIGLLALTDLFLESGCHRLLGYCLTHPRH